MDRGELVGYSPWGCKESDMTEATEHTHTQTHTQSEGTSGVGRGV